MFKNAQSASQHWYPKRYAEYQALDCDNKEDKDEPPHPNDWPKEQSTPNNENTGNGRFEPISPIHDPSGYVYEAVETNRLPGVTATCYYKEWWKTCMATCTSR